MTNPGPNPDGTLTGAGGIAAWGAQNAEAWKNSLGQGVIDSTDKIKLFGGGVADTQSELAGLQDRTQELEGVIGYAHAYANGGFSLSLGSVKYPMSNQIGRVVGATMTNGSFVLGSKGLWVADGQATFDIYRVGVKKISVTLKVFAPNGSIHFQRTALTTTEEEFTHAVHMPFTVPSAGYYVELWVNAAIGRGVYGGSEWNGLSVSKISTETS